MPQFIQDDVRDVMADPAHGQDVVLVVGLDPDADADVVAERLRDAGADIDDELPFDTLAVSVSEEDVAALTEVDGVSSIEFDRDIEVMSSGNSTT